MNLKIPEAILPLCCAFLSNWAKTVYSLIQRIKVNMKIRFRFHSFIVSFNNAPNINPHAQDTLNSAAGITVMQFQLTLADT